MGTINIWTMFVLALAPLLGYILGRFAKEELALGKKWLTLAKRLLFIIAGAVYLYAYRYELWHVVLGLVVLFAYLALPQYRAWWWTQAALAVSYAYSMRTPLSFVSASAIFLYGLPTGAILAQKKQWKAALVAGTLFLIVAFLGREFLP
jgi:hypothetical protein